MKCEKSKAEFTVKEQAKAKGCCPSCGVKLTAADYRNDDKGRRWYQYHSPMPLSMILAYVYLVGGGGADDCVGIGQFGTVVGDGSGCVAVHHNGSSDLLVACLCIVLHAVGAAMAGNAPRGYACV